MERNGHLTWNVPYSSGNLRAVGTRKGKSAITDVVKTTSEGVTVNLAADVKSIKADKEDLAILTVDLKDKNGLHVSTALNEISFSIEGPGKIIGVGNGNPTSLEPDQFLETITTVAISELKEKIVESLENRPETADGFDDSNWKKAFANDRTEQFAQSAKAIVYRASFSLSAEDLKGSIAFFYNSIGKNQFVYINGIEVGKNLPQSRKGDTFKLDVAMLKAGNNTIAIAATPLFRKHSWESINTEPGLIQVIKPAAQWKRKLFSGLAQVIVQSTGQPGEIILKANSAGLKPATITIPAIVAKTRLAVN